MSKFDNAATATVKGPGVTPVLSVGNDGNLKDNQDNIVLLASGVVTADGTSADQVNNNCRCIKVFIDPGTFGATESGMVVTLQGKNTANNTYYDILASAALTASTEAILSVFPGAATTANVSANDILPPVWRVKWHATAWGTGGSTLGISAATIV